MKKNFLVVVLILVSFAVIAEDYILYYSNPFGKANVKMQGLYEKISATFGDPEEFVFEFVNEVYSGCTYYNKKMGFAMIIPSLERMYIFGKDSGVVLEFKLIDMEKVE